MQDDTNFYTIGTNLIKALCEISSCGWNLVEKVNPNNFTFSKHIPLLESFTNQHPTDWRSFCDTMSNVGLMIAENMTNDFESNDHNLLSILKLLDGITQHKLVSNNIRANAFYLIGLSYLEQARKVGELKSLWAGFSSFDSSSWNASDVTSVIPLTSSKQLRIAQRNFRESVALAGPASILLCRKALRCLALSIGPHSNSDFGSSGEMVHTSVGCTARQRISRLFSADKDNDSDDFYKIFGAFDVNIKDERKRIEELANMYKRGSELIPQNWNFVAMTECPTGELLISSLILSQSSLGHDNFTYRTVCIFPPTLNIGEKSGIVHDVLMPFDDIMNESKEQLNGVSLDDIKRFNTDRDAKLRWWKAREDIDDRLKTLLNRTQLLYFNASCVQEIFSLNDDDDCANTSFGGGNLAARFEEACHIGDNSISEKLESKDILQKLTVKELKEKLEDLNVPFKDFRSLRKAELIELLIEKQFSDAVQTRNNGKSNNDAMYSRIIEAPECTFLILDENITRFPFEGIPLLSGRTVCRIPSFPFAISSLHRSRAAENQGVINPAVTTFILDPESNLPGTQNRLKEAISGIIESNNWQWDGIVGQIPSEQFMKNALVQDNGLLLYFGHNGGERCFSKSQIESLTSPKSTGSKRQCKSSLLLMGCSSGVLLSVNQNGGKDMLTYPLHFEPEGVALSYICAGAPCVVSNLWDVTDVDIDR